MRIFIGLLWAFGGTVAGFVVGALVGAAIQLASNTSNREGAVGYSMMVCGAVGAVIGIVAGIALYARSAPTGQAGTFAGSTVMGVVGLVALVALAVWTFVYLRESPALYDGAMANLEMELRVSKANAPVRDVAKAASSAWFEVEVQTTATRPEGSVLWSKTREEGESLIIPVEQGPLYRAGNRAIVVRVNGRQVDVFTPPMKRQPDPKADWSEWYGPTLVEPQSEVVPKTPLPPIFELRYRVRRYGD